ncbi:MAG: hypothetical protein ACR2MT_05940 [Aurantibacter sp.]
MKQIRPIFIFSLLFLFSSTSISGQVKTYEADYYNWFDGIIGVENSELHHGIVYVEKHRTKGKKTKFFPEPDFVSGSIFFDGQPYFDLNLKYDVYDDELLMQVNKRLGGSILQLYKAKVDSFAIGGHNFVKINNAKIKSGFYEVSLERPLFSLMKKHRKNLTERLGKKLVFYEFEDGKRECFLYYQQNYHSIKKVSDLTELFPEHASKLKSYYENQSSNSNFDILLEGLLVYLDTLLPNEANKTHKN